MPPTPGLMAAGYVWLQPHRRCGLHRANHRSITSRDMRRDCLHEALVRRHRYGLRA